MHDLDGPSAFLFIATCVFVVAAMTRAHWDPGRHADVPPEPRTSPSPHIAKGPWVSGWLDVADLSSPLETVYPWTTAGAARARCESRGIHHLTVLEDGRLAGVLCLCDLENVPSSTPVGERMTRDVVTVPAIAEASIAAARMRRHGVGCLPVVSGDAVIGMITSGDLLVAGFEPRDLGVLYCAMCNGRRHVRRSGETPVCTSCRAELAMASAP